MYICVVIRPAHETKLYDLLQEGAVGPVRDQKASGSLFFLLGVLTFDLGSPVRGLTFQASEIFFRLCVVWVLRPSTDS